MHILSPVTDNSPSWIRGRGRMTQERFHDQCNDLLVSAIIMWPSWDSNLRRLHLQSDTLSTILWSLAPNIWTRPSKYPGPAVQSIVSLTSSLVVKMLTVLVSIISDSQVFFSKNVSSFCKSYSHYFSKNISIYAVFNDQSFNDTSTNDIVSFEQLGPVDYI